MRSDYVWDAFVRIFHWSLAGLFLANAILLDPDAQIHRWVGYGVMALVLLPLVWGFIGSTHARFENFPPDVRHSVEQLKDMIARRPTPHAGHSPLGALMIYNLFATILAIGATGYLMTTNTFWGIAWPEELHEALVTWAEISVALHVLAVLFESHRNKVDLAGSMVTGYKELPMSHAKDHQN